MLIRFECVENQRPHALLLKVLGKRIYFLSFFEKVGKNEKKKNV